MNHLLSIVGAVFLAVFLIDIAIDIVKWLLRKFRAWGIHRAAKKLAKLMPRVQTVVVRKDYWDKL